MQKPEYTRAITPKLFFRTLLNLMSNSGLRRIVETTIFLVVAAVLVGLLVSNLWFPGVHFCI